MLLVDGLAFAAPGRVHDADLPLLADDDLGAPMLRLVDAAGFGALKPGRGARLDKRFLLFTLAVTPLTHRRPGGVYRRRGRYRVARRPAHSIRVHW